ncbi:MAG: hypothetical protein CXR30_01000 [Geobacter sp.]|nr:MAG: hypothetical protein CXR30_01000 [Geobacter sp.]
MLFQRTLLLLIMLAIPVMSAASGVQRVAAVARISAVTVYPDRAMTTRSATLNLKPGSYLVAFEGLPTLLQDDSVRVAGKGSAGVTIVGVEVQRSFVEQVPEKLAKELEGEIQALERKVGGLDAKKAALAAQKNFIDSIRVAWGDRISKELAVGKPTAAELNDALNFVGNGVTHVEEQQLDLAAEQKQLRDRIDALQRRREQVVGSNRKEAKTVEVSLDVTRAGNFVLDLSGILPQAGWEPSYDARLAADGKSAELTFRAMVRQQTGEDWQGVNMSLSTARPAVGGTPPELSPWRISFYHPPPPVPMAAPSRFAMKSARVGNVMAEVDRQMPAEQAEEPAGYLAAGMTEEQTSVSFHIARPVDVPSDGTLHGNVVAIEDLPLTLEYLAVPKLSPSVYLRSEIVNRAGYPLLPGRVNVFTGNDYSGSSRMKKVAAGEKFELYFGSDDQVTVKREELKSHKEAGLFGKNRMSYRYRIVVQNFHKDPRTVVVQDQLPLAGDEEIKVNLDDPSVKPDEIKGDGTMTWRIPVTAGGKAELTFGILVEYPKDREITGL